MSGHLIVGPILGFRGAKEGRWYTSALVVLRGTATPPQLTVSFNGMFQAAAEAVLLKTYADCHVWRLDWWVRQTDSEQTVSYAINGGELFEYVVPEQNEPLRICYGSCFGVHTLKELKKVKSPLDSL